MLGMTEAGSVRADQRRRIRPTRSAARIVRQARARIRDQDHRPRHAGTGRRRGRRTVHPRAIPDAVLLQAQSRRMLRRRRLVPHRRFGARRRRRIHLFRRPAQRDDQDRGRQCLGRRGGAGDRQGHRRSTGLRCRHPGRQARRAGRRGCRRAGAAVFDEAALRERLKAELSAYKIPKRFIALPSAEIPLLSSGKVDTRQLRKLFDA